MAIFPKISTYTVALEIILESEFSKNSADKVTPVITIPITKLYESDQRTTLRKVQKVNPDPTTMPMAARNMGRAQLTEANA